MSRSSSCSSPSTRLSSVLSGETAGARDQPGMEGISWMKYESAALYYGTNCFAHPRHVKDLEARSQSLPCARTVNDM